MNDPLSSLPSPDSSNPCSSAEITFTFTLTCMKIPVGQPGLSDFPQSEGTEQALDLVNG